MPPLERNSPLILLYTQSVTAAFDQEKIKKRKNPEETIEKLASLCFQYYTLNSRYSKKTRNIENAIITPLLRIYHNLLKKRKISFIENEVMTTYNLDTSQIFDLLDKITKIPAVINYVEEPEKNATPQNKFINVLTLFDHLFNTYNKGLQDFLNGKKQEQFLLPQIKKIPYQLNEKEIVKTNVHLSFNTDPLENILHTVDTCRFNLRNSTLGSLLDTADPHIQYLCLKSSHKKTPKTLGIAIIHESEGIENDNLGKKYLLIEGFFGINALNLTFGNQNEKPNEHNPLFEYILDSLVKLSHEKERELLFNVSFNTKHASQGNFEWANFLVRQFSNLDEDLYIPSKEKKDRKGNQLYTINANHKNLENKWPTIGIQKERTIEDTFENTTVKDGTVEATTVEDRTIEKTTIENKTIKDTDIRAGIIGEFRYCNAYFRHNEKRYWNKAKGEVRYVGIDAVTIAEKVKNKSFGSFNYDVNRRQRRIWPYALSLLLCGIAGLGTYSAITGKNVRIGLINCSSNRINVEQKNIELTTIDIDGEKRKIPKGLEFLEELYTACTEQYQEVIDKSDITDSYRARTAIDKKRFTDDFNLFLDSLHLLKEEIAINGLIELLENRHFCDHYFFRKLSEDSRELNASALYNYWSLLSLITENTHEDEELIMRLSYLRKKSIFQTKFANMDYSEQFNTILKGLKKYSQDLKKYPMKLFTRSSNELKHHHRLISTTFSHILDHVSESNDQEEYERAVVFSHFISKDCTYSEIRACLDLDILYPPSLEMCNNDLIDTLDERIKKIPRQDLELFLEKDFAKKYKLCNLKEE